ncbi:MAG TPA: DUF418 domain-containing protein [Croceibacterium sp.]|nr:DUF418 domain-containing protein [Croceibacterium sp.]
MNTPDDVEEQPRAPVVGRERLVALDFIRGIAVLGILFANITAYAHPYTAYYWPPAITGGMTMGDQAVWVFQFVFVDGKFRGLFTVLFGAGMMLFLDRAWARGAGRWRQLRRLAWLLVFGLIHFFLIWRGDILTLYAVWGIVALPAARLPAVNLLGAGLTMYLFGQLAITAIMGRSWLATTSTAMQARISPEELAAIAQAPATTLARAQGEGALYAHGSWLEIAGDTISNRAGELLQELMLVGPTETLGLLFIGMALYRMGFFTGAADPAAMRRWGWTGVLGGAALSLVAALWVVAGQFELLRTLFVFNGLSGLLHLPMTLGLAALLVTWAPSAARTRLGARFVAAGRVAFTNYLGTSLLMVALFQGWGLGLFGRFHRVELIGFVVAAWLLMLAWSKWWLDRFNYGPLEWLWRCLTYGQVIPLRRLSLATAIDSQ